MPLNCIMTTNNIITMNKKQMYITPEMEVVKISIEAGILSFSDTGSGQASADGMTRGGDEVDF